MNMLFINKELAKKLGAENEEKLLKEIERMKKIYEKLAESAGSNVDESELDCALVEDMSRLRKEFEAFKGYITDKFVDLKFQCCSTIADCKRAIAELHGIIMEQRKEIQALEEKLESVSECKPDNPVKPAYATLLLENEKKYYLCRECCAVMRLCGDNTLICTECRRSVKK